MEGTRHPPVDEERDSVDLTPPDPGRVHHLSFRIDGDRIGQIRGVLEDVGYAVTKFDRGAFHSLYTTDHNCLVIELVAASYAVPDDRRGEVLATPHALRVEDGADYVEREHMREAIDRLGLEVGAADFGDAPTGRGV